MKKITDENVARSLGWKLEIDGDDMAWFFNGKYVCLDSCLPAFTTSLDAIVGEIERRGIDYSVNKIGSNAEASLGIDGEGESQCWMIQDTKGQTAPLALCAALIQYLKESRP